MSASNSPKVVSQPQDVFLPGVVEGFKKRFPNDDLPTSTEKDFSIDSSDIVLLDQLARGAYGIVYKGVIRGKTFAIKVQEEVPALEEQVNILVELTLLKTLKHDRLVASCGSSRIIEKRSPFEVKIMIAMELCDNGALRECLARNLSWELRIRIALDVISGINYMHEMRIVHRDIKTTNILISGDWRAKVCDFSFACHVDNLSKHDYVYGTDEFMAPEIALGEDFGTAADIFSYGIVMAEMVSGQEPSSTFLKRSARDLFALDEDELRGAVLPDCPDSLEALTLMCCEKEGEFRITAAEVVDWLQDLFNEKGGDGGVTLPEKEVHDFSNVVSPIREGTVVYPKTDDAHLIRYKSINNSGSAMAINFMKRSGTRSKSMNGTPSRAGAVIPIDAKSPLEREKLSFDDATGLGHNGEDVDSAPHTDIELLPSSANGSRPDVSPLNTSSGLSMSSMLSRVAYLELQIQELKAENKSITRGVSALVMMSEDMKRAARDGFGDGDNILGPNAKRTPRSATPRGTPNSQSAHARKVVTHRKSRSDDVTITRTKMSPQSQAEDGSMYGDLSESEGLVKRTPPPPPPPPHRASMIAELEEVIVEVTDEVIEEDKNIARNFADLKKNVQNLVGSGHFGNYVDPSADTYPPPLTHSHSTNPDGTKKGPAGAMKLFGIESFGETKLRKVGSNVHASTPSPSEKNSETSPYDRGRLRPVPPPPPKNDSSSAASSPVHPPPPATRSSIAESPLFSDTQLAVIKEMIKSAVEEERKDAHRKYKRELESRLAEEKKTMTDYVDAQISAALQNSAMVVPASSGSAPPLAMTRNMSVSFGGLYRDMFDEIIVRGGGAAESQDEINQKMECVPEDTIQIDQEIVDGDSETEQAVKKSTTMTSPQRNKLEILEGQMELLLAALAKMSLPPVAMSETEAKLDAPSQSGTNRAVEEEQDVDDDEEEEEEYHRHYHRGIVNPVQYEKYSEFDRGNRSHFIETVSPMQKGGTYSGHEDYPLQSRSFPFENKSGRSRGSPSELRSPSSATRGADPPGDLANAFRSFISVINHADGPGVPAISPHQSRNELEAGIQPGYYDFSGRPVSGVSSPHSNTRNSPSAHGSAQRHRQSNSAGPPATTPASRRGVSAETPLSAGITWRSVGSGGTASPHSGLKQSRSPSSSSRLHQSSRSRSSSKGNSSGGPGKSKYNQIGTRGTPRDSEADSSLAQEFFRMHNTGTSLEKEEAAMQRKSPMASGHRFSDMDARGSGPGNRPKPTTPVSLRQILNEGGI